MRVRTVQIKHTQMGNTTSSTPPSRTVRTGTETPLLEPVHQGFNPTRQDVQVAVQILMGLRLRATPGYLPPELALSILAHADYRPRITASRAAVVDYRWEPRPWYLTTPMLPPDFVRARSVTLQVRSADHMDWETFAVGCDGAYEGCHTWFEMCILRPLREAAAAAAPVCGGGGLRHWQEQGPEVRMSRTFRGGGDADQDFRRWDKWLVVNHNGRETWVVRHSGMVSCPPGENERMADE
jgi:hypothetical protein